MLDAGYWIYDLLTLASLASSRLCGERMIGTKLSRRPACR